MEFFRMIFHSQIRRNAVVALLLICLLVCGGLAWATWTGLQLEAIEAASARERTAEAQVRSNENKIALTLTFLDGIVDSALAVERSRPFEHYRAFYRPAKAINLHDRLPATDVVVPSPLLNFSGPDWILLHFQYSKISDWTSPELDSDAEAAVLRGTLSPPNPQKLAAARRGLEALRDADPFKIQNDWDVSDLVETERINSIDRSATVTDKQDESPGRLPSIDGGNGGRTAEEFAERGRRLVGFQRSYLPREECQPFLVAIDNLQIPEENVGDVPSDGDCSFVSVLEMRPIWLQLAPTRTRQLALVRIVSMERINFCTLQGVLIDWEALKGILESEAQRIVPGATIEPVELGSALPNTLRTIPVRLVAPAVITHAGQSPSGMKWGILLTWGATILALAAICWGAMKYVGILERRMEFVAAVTHELRTPLTSFQIYTDLLADFGDHPEKRSQYVETLRKESKRLARLVENVLGYSKIGGAKPQLNLAPQSPQSILDAITLQTAEQCRAAGKELVIENRCPSDRMVVTDPEFVIQILANLVENACKYSGDAADPRVWLTAGVSPDGGVEFEVEDLGLGVAAADRRAIFRPFRRSSSARSSQTTGMGLGLALSRYWANCLGGQLLLRRGDRNGENFTRFALCLPELA